MRTWARRPTLIALLSLTVVCFVFLAWAGGRREIPLEGTLQSGFEQSAFFPHGDCSKAFWFNWPDARDYDLNARIRALGYPSAVRVKLIGNVSRLGRYGHLGYYAREVWPITVISVSPARPCGQGSPTPDFYDEVSQALVGQQITIRGRFSLHGKIAPASVMLDNHEAVYLPASWGWGATYSDMEGKRVAATGILRFYHAPPSERTDRPEARLPDHFFLETETAQVRLIRP